MLDKACVGVLSVGTSCHCRMLSPGMTVESSPYGKGSVPRFPEEWLESKCDDCDD